jgi:PPE-repeat protein
MDFGALPPEVNSGRMYIGPGPETLLAASAGWEGLAAELHGAAGGYQSVISGLTDESWMGPSSMSMAVAVTPYLLWMRTTAAQCEEAATQATVAAAAYETAFAMTVPPPMVVANRIRLATLIATNVLGQNTPAIAATEAEYSEMWAQDATAMYNYAASSATASAFKAFTSPPRTTNPSGLAARAGAVGQAAGTKAQTTSTQLMSAVTQALQRLTTPGSSSGMGLSVASSGASAPASALSSLTGASGKSAKTAGATGSLSGLASNGLSSLMSLGSNPDIDTDAVGLGFDGVGLGTDFGGTGLDFGGIAMDIYGTGLDMAGLDSLSGIGGASGMGGLGAVSGLGGAAPLDGGGALGAPWAGFDGGASASLGQAIPLGTLSVPPSWADALSVATPAPILDANVMPGGWGAMPSSGTGPVSKLPLGAMVGRESEGAVQRIGFRSSMIPRSPLAG